MAHINILTNRVTALKSTPGKLAALCSKTGHIPKLFRSGNEDSINATDTRTHQDTPYNVQPKLD